MGKHPHCVLEVPLFGLLLAWREHRLLDFMKVGCLGLLVVLVLLQVLPG